MGFIIIELLILCWIMVHYIRERLFERTVNNIIVFEAQDHWVISDGKEDVFYLGEFRRRN